MMRVNIDGLRQQSWRAEKLYTDCIRYAKSIGCTVTVIQDEIVSDDRQARLLANWWQEHAV
jgi:hypothetical protein